MDQISKFHQYSLAVVAVNKPLNTHEIECVPIETSPMADGELTDNVLEFSTKGKDSFGAAYEAAANTTVTVKAVWLPYGGSNRITSPDVRRGETVVLFRFGDVDKFYWTTIHNALELRKLETVIFAISNTRKEEESGSADNTYFFEWSTHNKMLHLHTSKSDGEPFVYDIQLNTKEGYLQIQDDIGNFISLDSKNVRLEMKNRDGSHLDIDRKNIFLTAPDSITMKAGNNINMEAGKSINSKAGSSINDETSNITTKATMTKNTVPMTEFSGNVVTKGATSTVGISSTGGGTFGGGGFTVTGGGTFTGHVNVASLTSQGNVDAPNIG